MNISKKGIELIKSFEGCLLTAYKDASGIWTIGFGHTNGVKSGQKITKAQAEEYLLQDIAKFEKHVSSYDSKYSWNQNEFDALVSFAFNIGNIDQLTAKGSRRRSVIAEKMLLYVNSGGKKLEGLVKRRQAEHDLFLTPVKVEYYAKCSASAKSIVDALKTVGETDTSLAHRILIANANGISYNGDSYNMNLSLLAKLKQGKLKKC